MNYVPENHFSRGGAFYPLVMCYIHQLVGMRDMAVRAHFGSDSVESKLERYLKKQGKEGCEETAQEALRQIELLCGPLDLFSRYDEKHIHIDIDLIAKETGDNIHYIASYMLISAGQLLITAFELIKEDGKYSPSPILEFLRHCRNAAAHGGKFNLRGNEPRREASWRKFTISQQDNGFPLFRKPNGEGMLGVGDPIRLLWDIEQEHPEIGPCERIYDHLMPTSP